MISHAQSASTVALRGCAVHEWLKVVVVVICDLPKADLKVNCPVAWVLASLHVRACADNEHRKPVSAHNYSIPRAPQFRIFIHFPMEALVALSLAGTIVQFIDFGTKILSRGHELYKAKNGQLAAHYELQIMISDLHNVVLRIRNSATPRESQLSTALAHPEGVDSIPSSAIHRVCEEAIKVAEAILLKLEALKLDPELKESKLETFAHVCGRLWSTEKEKGEVDRLVARLDSLKDAINREVLAAVL